MDPTFRPLQKRSNVYWTGAKQFYRRRHFFFKSSLAGKAKDVLGNMLIDYFGDEGTVELEFNCLITFIKVNNENH